MFVRYVTHSNATVDSIKTDIISLVNGQISTANDFGDSCQKSNTTVVGTYPANTYAVVNATSMTFSKNHSDYANTTHYFRIQISGNNWVSTVLARGYTPETDTLVNGVQYPTTNTNTSMSGSAVYYFVVSNTSFYIDGQGGVTKSSGIFDLGHTGLSRLFTNSMLMAHTLNLDPGRSLSANVTNPVVANVGTFSIPHTYNIQTFTYAAVANLFPDVRLGGKASLANGSLYFAETPLALYGPEIANSQHFVYGISRTGGTSYAQYATYTDTSNAYRVHINGYAITI